MRQQLRKRWLRRLAAETRLDLLTRFPKTFCQKKHPKKPLKVGIFEDLLIACPDLKKRDIYFALYDYCSGPSYQAALILGGSRFDLDGNPCGSVSEKEAEEAQKSLIKIMEKLNLRLPQEPCSVA